MAFCGLPFPLMNCIKPSSNKNGSQVKIRFSFIPETVEFAVEEEEEVATRLAMQEIMKKVEGITEKIKEVGETAAKSISNDTLFSPL